MLTFNQRDHLFEINFLSVTKSHLDKLQSKIDELNKQINYLETTPVTTIWKNEIDEFIEEYEKELDSD